MLASYFLSRTLVPTMVLFLLAAEEQRPRLPRPSRRSIFRRIGDGFEAGFRRFARAYEGPLDWALEHRAGRDRRICWRSRLVSLFLYPFVGRDFFPSVDAGQLRLHVRCPPGTRIEQSEVYFQHVEDYIRQVIPANELERHQRQHRIAEQHQPGPQRQRDRRPFRRRNPRGAATPNHHPTADYLKTIRAEFPQRFPNLQLFTQPADIVSQILNFGLPAPIDIQVSGPIGESDKNYQIAQQIAKELTARARRGGRSRAADHQLPAHHDRHRSHAGASRTA